MQTAPHPIEPDDHRRARHLFTLKALTERGAVLAHKAADQAEAQLDTATDQPDPNAPNHHHTFERYVRLVRLLIALEHRIATAATTRRRPYRPTHGPGADPRRPKLRDYLHQATRSTPDPAPLRRELFAALDDALDRDPAHQTPAADLLAELCETYGLQLDLSQLPDEFLDTLVGQTPPETPNHPS